MQDLNVEILQEIWSNCGYSCMDMCYVWIKIELLYKFKNKGV
jgi:hypothetical protein